MRLILLFFLLMFLVASGEEIVKDYHIIFGIPEAERIRKEEQASSRRAGPATRVIGGSVAGLGAFPYFGGLVISLSSGSTSVCGSCLLSNTKLVTAAHCWRTESRQAQSLTVVLASTKLFSGGTRITTSAVEVHPNYDPNTFNNDIALITIARVEFNSCIQPVALASGDQDYENTWAQAAGFGKTSDAQQFIPRSTYLSQVSLQVISNAQCRQSYAAQYVIGSTLCTRGAGSSNTCSGDSGGPLVVGSGNNVVLIGITSFGAIHGCELGFPTGFTRITSFYTWIRNRL